jgi:D-3-phosphoglycerate dehydrogenase / 2-oxoglutarate reductase
MKWHMAKFLITTVFFGGKNCLPMEALEEENIEYLINPLNKKLVEDKLAELVGDFDAISIF